MWESGIIREAKEQKITSILSSTRSSPNSLAEYSDPFSPGSCILLSLGSPFSLLSSPQYYRHFPEFGVSLVLLRTTQFPGPRTSSPWYILGDEKLILAGEPHIFQFLQTQWVILMSPETYLLTSIISIATLHNNCLCAFLNWIVYSMRTELISYWGFGPQNLTEWLAYTWCTIDTCWMNKWIDEWAHIPTWETSKERGNYKAIWKGSHR